MNEYSEAKVLYLETKERQRALHNIVKQLQDKNAPAHALLEYVSSLTSFRHLSPVSCFIIDLIRMMLTQRRYLRTYAKKHKELIKARDDSKKKCQATFKKMTAKWEDSDKLVCTSFPCLLSYNPLTHLFSSRKRIRRS